MPKKCIKFVSEYLIPNLDNKTFGDNLKWIDKSKNVFEIHWQHKAGPEWTEKQVQVFVEWDKHKGHFNPQIEAYYTKSKQRFRALLYKLTKVGQLIELPSKNKFKKVFRIGQKPSRRRKTDTNLEYEFNNEEETSVEEQELENPDAMTCREISENEAVNVLEDHSYQKKTTNASENFLLPGFILYNKQYLNDFEKVLVPISSNDPSSDNFQKRILVEQNYENLPTLTPAIWPSVYDESYSLSEDLRLGPENSGITLFAGKLPTDFYIPMDQKTTLSATMFSDTVNSSSSSTMEFFEQSPMLCPKYDEEQD